MDLEKREQAYVLLQETLEVFNACDIYKRKFDLARSVLTRHMSKLKIEEEDLLLQELKTDLANVNLLDSAGYWVK